jgi:hypothetical protein
MIYFFRFILLNPFCTPEPRLVTWSILVGLLDLNKMRHIYMARHCTGDIKKYKGPFVLCYVTCIQETIDSSWFYHSYMSLIHNFPFSPYQQIKQPQCCSHVYSAPYNTTHMLHHCFKPMVLQRTRLIGCCTIKACCHFVLLAFHLFATAFPANWAMPSAFGQWPHKCCPDA